jgi:hypothetical protein
LVAVDKASVTAGVNEKGGNANPKILVNSGGHIVQPRYWVVRVFGWVIYAIGNHHRLRLGHRFRFGFGERFRFCYWFGHYDGFGN